MVRRRVLGKVSTMWLYKNNYLDFVIITVSTKVRPPLT